MSPREQKNLNHQIQSTKKYLKFCNKLFTASSIEFFLSHLYKETKLKFKIRSLIFYWPSGHYGEQQYVCDSKGIYKCAVSYGSFPEQSEKHIRVGNKENSQYLANSLGRPVQNILVVPIRTTQYGINSSIYLFVEFYLKNHSKLLLFYESHLELIMKCLDRLLLKDHLETGIELWTSTFNGLKEPLAVFDENNKLSNSNDVFDEICANSDSNFLNQKTFQWKGKVFERHSYSVPVNKDLYTIYHYVDVSESLHLRSRMIQNIKMSALGELGENVAHQLSNPLTGVLSMAQLLLHSYKSDPEVRKDIEDIVTGVSRSQEIISNLLDFSREDNKLYVCDLNKVVQKTLPFLKSLISFPDFLLELYEKPVFVKVQAGLLQQVIFNIIKNACQAVSELPCSSQKVKVRVCQDGCHAVLHIEDSGKGISVNDYENVFKPFFTTKGKSEGTGLGLSMSRSIVESFKGRLKVGNSSLGGACFSLSLPLQYKNQ